MTDKDPKLNPVPDPVFVKMDQVLAQMAVSIDELREAVMVMSAIPRELMVHNERRAKRTELVTRVVQSLMSGRWHRRDGDSYGIVRQPGVNRDTDLPHADNPPGDLRPSSERRD